MSYPESRSKTGDQHASRRRFIKAYTNQVLHFGTTVTSRGEGGHAQFKRHLEHQPEI